MPLAYPRIENAWQGMLRSPFLALLAVLMPVLETLHMLDNHSRAVVREQERQSLLDELNQAAHEHQILMTQDQAIDTVRLTQRASLAPLGEMWDRPQDQMEWDAAKRECQAHLEKVSVSIPGRVILGSLTLVVVSLCAFFAYVLSSPDISQAAFSLGFPLTVFGIASLAIFISGRYGSGSSADLDHQRRHTIALNTLTNLSPAALTPGHVKRFSAVPGLDRYVSQAHQGSVPFLNLDLNHALAIAASYEEDYRESHPEEIKRESRQRVAKLKRDTLQRQLEDRRLIERFLDGGYSA